MDICQTTLEGQLQTNQFTANIQCVASVSPTLLQVEALFASLPEYSSREEAAADLQVGKLYTGADGSDSLSQDAIYIVK